MFSLIITIISIALVAALAVASVYYGGSAFSQGTAKAAAATLVAQAQQISGATTLYANDNSGALPTSINDLTPAYLSAIPTVADAVSTGAWAVDSSTGFVSIDLVEANEGVRDQINALANGSTQFSVEAVTPFTFTYGQ